MPQTGWYTWQPIRAEKKSQLAADDLRLLSPRRKIGRVHDRRRVYAPRRSLCSPDGGTVHWIEIEVRGPAAGRGKVIVGGRARVEGIHLGEPSSLGDEGGPVDGVVHRPPQASVREERPAHVHVQVSGPKRLADEVLLVPRPGSIAAGSIRGLQSRSRLARQLEGVVGLSGFDLLEGARGIDPDCEHDLVETVGAAAGVVGIASQNELLARSVRGDVVGASGGNIVDPALVGRRVGWDSASGADRDIAEKGAVRVRQPDGERAPARDDAGDLARLAFDVGPVTDDSAERTGQRRFRA